MKCCESISTFAGLRLTVSKVQTLQLTENSRSVQEDAAGFDEQQLQKLEIAARMLSKT